MMFLESEPGREGWASAWFDLSEVLGPGLGGGLGGAAVGLRDGNGTGTHGSRRVDVAVHLVIVPLDMVEVDCVSEPRGLEQVPGVGTQHRNLRQFRPVAFEMPVVDGVEPYEGAEQPNVGLSDGV